MVGAENYGQCKKDCAEALKLNHRNVKAWYRAASACLALDQIEAALDACNSGLQYDAQNTALRSLRTKIENRQAVLSAQEKEKQDRLSRARSEKGALAQAFKTRNITIRSTPTPPEIPESSIALSSPLDPTSTLSFPTMFLYPLHAQTDFIKAFAEDSSLAEHLEYILPLPWDESGEYRAEDVECYMETTEGGLIKAGKKLTLAKLLGSGKVEVLDGLVKVNVVPKARAGEWIADFKKRRGKE